GGGASLVLRAQRQPFRSFFETNNFYVFDLVGLQIRRAFPQGSEFGGNFDFFRSSYGEPAQPDPETHGIYRKDKAMRLEAYATLALRDHVGLRFALVKNRKYSNFPGAEYNGLVVSGGFVFGWN